MKGRSRLGAEQVRQAAKGGDAGTGEVIKVVIVIFVIIVNYLPHRHHWQYCKHYHNCEHNHHHHCHHHNDVTTRRSKMIPCRALFSLSISSSWRSGWFILIIIRSVLLAMFIIIRPVHLKLGQLKIVLFIIRLVLSQPSLRIYNQVTIPPHFYYGSVFMILSFRDSLSHKKGSGKLDHPVRNSLKILKSLKMKAGSPSEYLYLFFNPFKIFGHIN